MNSSEANFQTQWLPGDRHRALQQSVFKSRNSLVPYSVLDSLSPWSSFDNPHLIGGLPRFYSNEKLKLDTVSQNGRNKHAEGSKNGSLALFPTNWEVQLGKLANMKRQSFPKPLGSPAVAPAQMFMQASPADLYSPSSRAPRETDTPECSTAQLRSFVADSLCPISQLTAPSPGSRSRSMNSTQLPSNSIYTELQPAPEPLPSRLSFSRTGGGTSTKCPEVPSWWTIGSVLDETLPPLTPLKQFQHENRNAGPQLTPAVTKLPSPGRRSSSAQLNPPAPLQLPVLDGPSDAAPFGTAAPLGTLETSSSDPLASGRTCSPAIGTKLTELDSATSPTATSSQARQQTCPTYPAGRSCQPAGSNPVTAQSQKASGCKQCASGNPQQRLLAAPEPSHTAQSSPVRLAHVGVRNGSTKTTSPSPPSVLSPAVPPAPSPAVLSGSSITNVPATQPMQPQQTSTSLSSFASKPSNNSSGSGSGAPPTVFTTSNNSNDTKRTKGSEKKTDGDKLIRTTKKVKARVGGGGNHFLEGNKALMEAELTRQLVMHGGTPASVSELELYERAVVSSWATPSEDDDTGTYWEALGRGEMQVQLAPAPGPIERCARRRIRSPVTQEEDDNDDDDDDEADDVEEEDDEAE